MSMKENIHILKIHLKKPVIDWLRLAVFYLLLLQGVLENVNWIFAYIDEVFALLGIGWTVYDIFRTGRLKIKSTSFRMICLLLLFFFSGWLGNLIYQYQPMKYVLIDMYTNIKFFLSIVSGFVLFRSCNEKTGRMLSGNARFAVLCLFVMLLADQLFHVFPSPEMRYGLRVSQLIYIHATYLAGSMIFLISVLTIFYDKKNNKYIIMSLAVLFFTLRSKALGGAVVYILLVYFVLRKNKKIKVWHIVVLGMGVLSVAWDNLMYYYVDLEGQSARSVLTQTAFQILKDYFPIGTGFGTYASAVAGEHYSPVYVMYGFRYIYELGGNSSGWGFFSDTFWPIIIGQTGFVGTITFVLLLGLLFFRILKARAQNQFAYVTGIFIFAYLLISTTSEPAFHNSIAIPLASILGYIISLENQP